MDNLIRKILHENLLLEYAGYMPVFEKFINYAIPMLMEANKNGEDSVYFSNDDLKKCGIDNRVYEIEINIVGGDGTVGGEAHTQPSKMFELSDMSLEDNLNSNSPMFRYELNIDKSFLNVREQARHVLQHELTHLYEKTYKYKNVDPGNFSEIESDYLNYRTSAHNMVPKTMSGSMRNFVRLITYYLNPSEINAFMNQYYVQTEELINFLKKKHSNLKSIMTHKYNGHDFMLSYDSDIRDILIKIEKTIYKLEIDERYANDVYNVMKSNNMNNYFGKLRGKSKEQYIRYMIKYLNNYENYIEKKMKKAFMVCVNNNLNQENKEDMNNRSINNFNKNLQKY